MEYTDKDDITTYQAIKSLVGGELHTDLNGIIQYLGKVVELDENKIEAEVARLQAEYDAQEYARNRATAYDSVGNQLDLLFHDMTAGKGTKTGEWYKAVAKVKADNPKG
jgi:uncharacterized membrane-anchored protein